MTGCILSKSTNSTRGITNVSNNVDCVAGSRIVCDILNLLNHINENKYPVATRRPSFNSILRSIHNIGYNVKENLVSR